MAKHTEMNPSETTQKNLKDPKGSGNNQLIERLTFLESELLEVKEHNMALQEKVEHLQEQRNDFANRYFTVSRQNADLINRYVAIHRLHSTFEYAKVLIIIKEIVANMVGAEAFGVFILDDDKTNLVMVAADKLSLKVGETFELDGGNLSKTALTGSLYVSEDVEHGNGSGKAKGSLPSEPLVCIPLVAEGEPIGTIAIYKLLIQKSGLQNSDLEIFKLLTDHAAVALTGARAACLSNEGQGDLASLLRLL